MWSSRSCDHEQRALAATPMSRHRPRWQTASWEKVSRGGGACCGQVTVPPVVLHENDGVAPRPDLWPVWELGLDSRHGYESIIGGAGFGFRRRPGGTAGARETA